MPVFGASVTEGQVRPVDRRDFDHAGPRVACGAVGLHRVAEMTRILRALVQRVREPGAVLAGEEPPDPRLRGDVDGEPAELRLRYIRDLCRGGGQVAFGVRGEPLQPVGDVER